MRIFKEMEKVRKFVVEKEGGAVIEQVEDVLNHEWYWRLDTEETKCHYNRGNGCWKDIYSLCTWQQRLPHRHQH